MNIFVTDASPTDCAVMLDDKRLVKMVLETAQMLSTVSGGPYKPTHSKHPCTLWVGESCNNYKWTVSLLRELCKEYTYRYCRTHKCESLIETFASYPAHNLGKGGLTQRANCSGFETGNIFQSYRECMIFKWLTDIKQPRWTKRNPPTWSPIIQ